MKALHFHAIAANRGVAPALMFQTANVLGPFQRFLARSIDAAQARHFRCQLPWEPVKDVAVLTLTARDTRIRLQRPPPRWVISDWPVALSFDLEKRLMVVNRDATFRVLSATRTAEGLRIEPESPLLDGDQVYWCGRPCAIEPEGAAAPPRTLTTLAGRPLTLRGPLEADGDGGWTGLIESVFDDAELIADDEQVTVTVLPALHGVRRLFDAEGRSFEPVDGALKVDEPPAEGPLRADNGVRFAWQAQGRGGRAGRWVQLLAPSLGAEEVVDPRAAFFDDDVKEVWTQPRRTPDGVIKVHQVDRDRYQLRLDRMPPHDTLLHLPLDLRNLRLQSRALWQLAEAPLPHHAPLLRLCEDPSKVRWPAATPRWPTRWWSLTDETRSGTDEQRRFVAKALGTPDMAFLEGPPGSGKTTAICELIQQLVADGQRVLLCASTHAAIDNVLERLLTDSATIDAVRVGRIERVDENVQACQLDRKVEALVDAWRAARSFATTGEGDLREMAERAVMMAANLTCGTTMGILGHPLLREHKQEAPRGRQPVATAPHWDVLIVDEASKTLTQEFLVPALLARRHIIVGDVRQLPPFSDRADVVANLRALVDERGRDLFPADHQRAMLLLFRLLRRPLRDAGLRWLLVERPGVLDWIVREFEAVGSLPFMAARVVSRTGRGAPGLAEVTVADVVAGAPAALHLASADYVLVGEDVIAAVSSRLPADLVSARELTVAPAALAESDPWLFRHAAWGNARRPLRRAYQERRVEIAAAQEAEPHEQRWLGEHDLAKELAWRITRLHELRWSRDGSQCERLRRDLVRLTPRATDIDGAIDEIQDIGLPSVLEVLQTGIGAERSSRRSALTEGLSAGKPEVFDARFERLSFQHRMHADVSAFARETFYGDSALRDANTITQRDERLAWDYRPFASRRVWVDVRGREHQGENADEVSAIRTILQDFVRWTKGRPPPNRSAPRQWEVACLSFYAKQEGAIARMLCDLTGERRATRFHWEGVEIVCGTVDRFQGREADLVMLSMRNTDRVGFLDSPNRLNVAVTRARQQLVVVGNAGFFERSGTQELEALAKRTAREDGRKWTGGRR